MKFRKFFSACCEARSRESKAITTGGSGCALAMRHSLSAIFLCLSACVSIAEQDRPAVVTDPTPASHAELVATVSKALNGAPVTLAKDALTQEHVLFIERAAARDASGLRIDGRTLDSPEQFQLMRNGTRCVLVHVGASKRFQLSKTACTAT